MEILYQVNLKSGSSDADTNDREFPDELRGLNGNATRIKPKCAISARNLVGFTSYSNLRSNKDQYELNNNHTTTTTTNSGGLEEIPNGSHVYVADLNTPWDSYLVRSSTSNVVHLDWDSSGVRLLVGTEDGHVEVYGMSEDLLNKWTKVYSGDFKGESILTSCWLSGPRQVSIVPEKCDNMLYGEKYQVKAIRRGKGFSKSLDGVVFVSATGLVGSVINCTWDFGKSITTTEKLSPVRSLVCSADMAYSPSGEIVIVSANEKVTHPIKVTRVNVSLIGSTKDKAEFTIRAAQSLFIPTNGLCSDDTTISTVKFMNKINTESVLVGTKDKHGSSSMLYLFELVSQPLTLKSRFQINGSDSIPANRWQQTHQIPFSSTNIEDLTVLSYPISLPMKNNNTSPTNQQLTNLTTAIQPLLAVSLSNGNLHLIRSDTFQQVSMITPANENENTNFALKRDPDEIIDIKQPRLSGNTSTMMTGNLVSLQFTWSGSLLLALDTKSQMNLYKIHSNIDPSTATSLIELSMIGGLDPWDILMCLKPNMVENITDRLSETFARQPPPVQSLYNTKILVTKAALYRLAFGGLGKTQDQQTLLTLNLVSGALKSLLRPSNLSSHDRGPAEALSNLLSTKGEALSDVDKVLLHLEAKEYTVEPTLLQSLQQQLQWIADLSLKLLSMLPDLSSARHSRVLGWEVCRDSKAIGTLRELIVLMRIWGLIRPACLPSFRKTSETLDVLPLLFRHLTKLSVSPHDPDESLKDECCLLPSEVQMPNINAYYPSKNHGVASISLLSRNTPSQFEFGTNPSKWLNNLDGQKNGGVWMDSLRLLWLGRNPAGVKACNRCGCATLIQSSPRSSANKAWDNRFIKQCPCGGNWKIPSSLSQYKTVETDSFPNI